MLVNNVLKFWDNHVKDSPSRQAVGQVSLLAHEVVSFWPCCAVCVLIRVRASLDGRGQPYRTSSLDPPGSWLVLHFIVKYKVSFSIHLEIRELPYAMSREDKDTGCGRALRAWEAHLGGGAMPLASGFIARWSRFDFRSWPGCCTHKVIIWNDFRWPRPLAVGPWLSVHREESSPPFSAKLGRDLIRRLCHVLMNIEKLEMCTYWNLPTFPQGGVQEEKGVRTGWGRGNDNVYHRYEVVTLTLRPLPHWIQVF